MEKETLEVMNNWLKSLEQINADLVEIREMNEKTTEILRDIHSSLV